MNDEITTRSTFSQAANTRINWPERIARLEAKMDQLCAFMMPMQQQIQEALGKNAEANARIANHMEESSRVWDRLSELEDLLADQSKAMIKLSETIIELKEQQRQSLEFISTVKRGIGLVAITMLGAMGWLLQKWVDHGR